MAIVTTRHSGVVGRKKPFTWSYSRMKNFEVCPKRHYEVDIAKTFKDDSAEALLWGNAVHDALAKRCGPDKTPLPTGMQPFERWAQKVLMGEERAEIYVEQNLAITQDFKSCGFFDAGVWYRAKGDFMKVLGDIALIVDWKTGKILEDSYQLALSAACMFARFEHLKAVRASFVWLKEDAESSEIFYRDDMVKMWRSLWPRIEALKTAYETDNYPPAPSRMCRSWCPVTSCPNHGKSF